MKQRSSRRSIFIKVVTWIIIIILVLAAFSPFIQYIFTPAAPTQ